MAPMAKATLYAPPPLPAGRAGSNLHGYRPPVIEHICAFSNMKYHSSTSAVKSAVGFCGIANKRPIYQ